jgi:hypothetical protein
MKKLFFVFISPVIISAGNIDLSFKNHKGQSSYTVHSNNSKDIKSKLVFPFNYKSIDLGYQQKSKYIGISLNSSFLLNAKTEMGKDYDWQYNKPTVYSQSENKIDKAYDISISLNINVSKNLKIFTKFNYKVLDMHWENTYQEDYEKDKNEYIDGKTLKFQQEFYKYNFGLNYRNKISKNISLVLKPSFVYAYINTKDTHILRDFYTIQHANAFGYEINSALRYNLTKKSTLKISITYIDIEDKDTVMGYYNKLNKIYASHPSSYNYKDTIVGIHYNYSF